MDNFSYFVTFYSLVLGLSLTELLSGFARLVRARALGRLEPQTALVALLTLIIIVATWVDGWVALRSVTVDLAGLWAPVVMAICYYLAAAVIFPHQEADRERLASYYHERRRFIVGMLLVGALLEQLIWRPIFTVLLARQPAVFWWWDVPYNMAIDGAMIALLFTRSRVANIVLLGVLIMLITIPYWETGVVSRAIARRYGYL